MSGTELLGHTCVVTGASSGIGRAIAVALTSAGATVCGIGREKGKLQTTESLAGANGRFVAFEADLVVDDQLERLAHVLLAGKDVDVVVHSAGTWSYGEFGAASVDDLDRLYAVNVRVPYLLTQALLPKLRARKGQVVFINSMAGLNARAGVAHYAASKHALRALADSLREEVNADGVRVLSVYPGRTATPLQAKVHATEGKPYVAERLMQADDVATAVVSALTIGRSAEVTDIMVRQMLKQ